MIPISSVGDSLNGINFTKDIANNIIEMFNNKENPLLGELLYNGYKSKDRTFKEVRLKNITHEVIDIYLYGETLYANINMLDTKKNQIAFSMLENGTGVLNPRVLMSDSKILHLIALDVIRNPKTPF